MMTGGSSGESAAAVASYTAAFAITEDMEGSTNTPAQGTICLVTIPPSSTTRTDAARHSPITMTNLDSMQVLGPVDNDTGSRTRLIPDCAHVDILQS
jgi:Asp-tRNA(Asn)/Glu-tRNA(Gln) amidotransferase A subunit family amidase